MNKVQYKEDLTGLQFGTLRVVGRAPGYENENKMWHCVCECGRPNCKHNVIMRRGNLTRKTPWKLTCGANGNNAEKSARTKFEKGIAQKNSKTGIAGVSKSCQYPGMYRARISINGKRITKDNLTLDEAKLKRLELEELKRSVLNGTTVFI